MPTLILSGGQFDGREVKSTDESDVIPDSLWFAQTGECKFILGDALTGKISMFDRWQIQPPIGEPVEFPAHIDLAQYHRAGRADEAGRIVFEYGPPFVVTLALRILLNGTSAITRSQAVRILKDVTTPVRVTIDFAGIESVGHSFVDEVFRVWENEHLDSLLNYVNADDRTEAMIRGVRKQRTR